MIGLKLATTESEPPVCQRDWPLNEVDKKRPLPQKNPYKSNMIKKKTNQNKQKQNTP